MKHQTPSQSATPINRTSPYTTRAKEFRIRRRWKNYMMKPPEAIMRIICDPYVANETRVLMGIEFFAWANLSDWAIDRMPKASLEGLGSGPDDPTRAVPMTQKRLGELIGMPLSTVNDAVKTLKASGYLRNHKYLFPEDSVKPSESEKDSCNDPVHPDSRSPLFRRLKALVIEQNKDFAIIPQLEDQIQKLEAKKSAVLEALAPYNKKLWQIYRDINRGKSPMGITKSLLESTDTDTAA